MMILIRIQSSYYIPNAQLQYVRRTQKETKPKDEVGVGVEAGSTQGRGARKKEVKKKHKPHTGRDVWKERSKERGSREER